MLPLVISFVGAYGLSLVFTYLVRGWATRVGVVDVPDGVRRCHDRPVPRLGGVAIFASSLVIWLASFSLFPHVRLFDWGVRSFWALALGGAAIFALGVWDDVRGLSAGAKLAVEVVVALGLFAAGIRIEGLGLWIGEQSSLPFWLSLLATTLWIVGITNAFNLIDGSDGVAAGASLFATTALMVVLLLFGNIPGALVALALAGAILGFLFFNFPPATIFLGDSGSLFIGFTLASLGVITTQTASTTLAVAIPVLSCGLPILDTLLAMVRRFLRGDHIFTPDRGHIHHRLRDLGHSPRKIALLLYAASAIFAVASLLLVEPSTRAAATTVLLVAGAVVWISIQRLHIPELLEFERIAHRALQQRHVIAHNVRIREAVAQIRAASDLSTLLESVVGAFQSGEFQRVRLWVHRSVMPARLVPEGFTRCRTGYCWVWSATSEERQSSPFDYWEVQIPFRGPDNRVIGRLSVWRSRSSRHLLTDLRLLALELQPEFHNALLRLHRYAAAEGPEIDVPDVRPLAGTGAPPR